MERDLVDRVVEITLQELAAMEEEGLLVMVMAKHGPELQNPVQDWCTALAQDFGGPEACRLRAAVRDRVHMQRIQGVW